MNRRPSPLDRLATALIGSSIVGLLFFLGLPLPLIVGVVALLVLQVLLARRQVRLTDAAAFLAIFPLGFLVAHAIEPVTKFMVPFLSVAQRTSAADPGIGAVDISERYQQRPNLAMDRPMSSETIIPVLEWIAHVPIAFRPAVVALDIAMLQYDPAETVPGYHESLLQFLEGPKDGKSYEERSGIAIVIGSQSTTKPSDHVLEAFPKLKESWASVWLAPAQFQEYQPVFYGTGSEAFHTLGGAAARRYREKTIGAPTLDLRLVECPYDGLVDSVEPNCIYVLPISAKVHAGKRGHGSGMAERRRRKIVFERGR